MKREGVTAMFFAVCMSALCHLQDFKMKIKKNLFICSGVLIAFLAAILLYIYIPSSENTWKSAVCRVKLRNYYVLPLGPADTLYISLTNDTVTAASFTSDSIPFAPAQSGCFVSNVGDVVTSDGLADNNMETLSEDTLKRRLARLDTLFTRRSEVLEQRTDELDYYAATHSVVDDGYNEVMAFREKCKNEKTFADSTLMLIKTALAMQKGIARLQTDCVIQSVRQFAFSSARLEVRSEGLLLLKTIADTLPNGVTRFSPYRFGVRAMHSRLTADLHIAECEDTNVVPGFLQTGSQQFICDEGGVYVNRSGHLSGLQRHGKRVGSMAIARLLRKKKSWPEWWWSNIRAYFGRSWREEADNVPSETDACVEMTVSDSLIYRGHVSNQRVEGRKMRCGFGLLVFPDGTTYCGRWSGDTLAYGTYKGNGETYIGNFDRNLKRQGRGTLDSGTGHIYNGEWKDGKRNGHGFSINPNTPIRCGEWKNDRFKGERMVYTADRVYGIDISRHQHEKGRKRYKINWSAVRITGLGSGRRIIGQANYPVSFVYIKATEGRSIRNKYYAADLRAARAQGIKVGSYHFFSPTSPAAVQANYFLKNTHIAKGDLPPVLDLEPTEKQIQQMGGEQSMFRRVVQWINIVEARCGKRPILYVGQQFVNKHLVNAPASLRKHPVWIARYGEYKPYVRLVHWQLTPYGRVNGIHGEVDINVFNGNKEQFRQMFK